MTTTTARTPAGTPAGGQFTATARTEPDVNLSPVTTDTPPVHPRDDRPEPLRTPAAEARFDAIWTGEVTGFSRTQVEERLAEHTQTLKDLNDRKIPPRVVIGTGYRKGRSRAIAVQWLTDQIEASQAALETDGRSDKVNQSNVRGYLRHSGQLQEAP